MTKAELLDRLDVCAEMTDGEVAHIEADRALLKFIDDLEINAAFQRVRRYYS